MRYWLVCLIFLLFTPPIYSSAEMDARAALALAMSQPIVTPPPPPPPPPPPKVDVYTNARKMSMVTGKPLVVYVGCPAKTLSRGNAIVISVPKLEGVEGPRVIVGKPGQDKDGSMTLYYAGDLSANASEQDVYDILDEINKQKVIQQAICIGSV